MTIPGMEPIEAQFDSKCAACGEKILAEADLIVRNEDGEWIHEGCEE